MPSLPDGDAQEEPVTPHPGPAQHGQAPLHLPHLHQVLQDPRLAQGPHQARSRLHQGGHRRPLGQDGEGTVQGQESSDHPSQGTATRSTCKLINEIFLRPLKYFSSNVTMISNNAMKIISVPVVVATTTTPHSTMKKQTTHSIIKVLSLCAYIFIVIYCIYLIFCKA